MKIKPNLKVRYCYVDLFCGLGGVTEGLHNAKNSKGQIFAKVIACVNHDPLAILSHEANHRDVLHFVEDIRDLDLSRESKLIAHIRMMKIMYPNAKFCLWGSIECINHSNAKGGLPKDADSRTLAYDLYRYIHAIDPDYIQIENVREFLLWGPLKIKAKKHHENYTELAFHNNKKTGKEEYWMEPIKERQSEDYNKWRDYICALGYNYEYKLLNCADFSAPTTRIRYFGIFAKNGLPIVFPKPTHAKKPLKGSGLKKWIPIKKVLDFSDEGESIFNRSFNMNIRKQNRKDLEPSTLWRLYDGCIKQIAGGKKKYEKRVKNFITQYYGNGGSRSINEPANTLSTKDRLALYTVNFMTHYHTPGGSRSIDEPANTLTVKDRISLCSLNYMHEDYQGPGRNQSIDQPCGALVTAPRRQVVSLKKLNFVNEDYSSGSTNKSIKVPCGSLLSIPKQNIVTLFHPANDGKFLMNTSFNNIGSSLDAPSPTLLASRKHHYLVNPGWFGHNFSVESPSPTIVASQHKVPLSICTLDESKETFYIHIYEEDNEPTRLLKEFMAVMGICDIKMRMLQIVEMKRITTLPDDYIIYGNLSDQKKFIGNAVPSILPKRWVLAMYEEDELIELKKAA